MRLYAPSIPNDLNSPGINRPLRIGAQKRTNLSPLAFYSVRCLPLMQFYVALGPDLTVVSGTLATLRLAF